MAAKSKINSSEDTPKIQRKKLPSKFKKTVKVVKPKNVSNQQSKPSKSKLRKMRSKIQKQGVVYLGHIPYGFFEDQIKNYFNQFGTVKRVRLSRSQTTGKSRGYGFIQFEDEDIAKIAVQAMNNYLMFERRLKCEYIPPERVHPRIFRPASKGIVRYHSQALDKRRHNCLKTEKKVATVERNTNLKLDQLKNKLASLGVAFNPKLVLKANLEVKCDEMNETEMIVDSSDDEVTFKTPPNVKKTKLKSKLKQ